MASYNIIEQQHQQHQDVSLPFQRGKKRARYTSKACDACRRRKGRCDGGYPCEFCNGKMLPCKYSYTDNEKQFLRAEPNDVDDHYVQQEAPGELLWTNEYVDLVLHWVDEAKLILCKERQSVDGACCQFTKSAKRSFRSCSTTTNGTSNGRFCTTWHAETRCY